MNMSQETSHEFTDSSPDNEELDEFEVTNSKSKLNETLKS